MLHAQPGTVHARELETPAASWTMPGGGTSGSCLAAGVHGV